MEGGKREVHVYSERERWKGKEGGREGGSWQMMALKSDKKFQGRTLHSVRGYLQIGLAW